MEINIKEIMSRLDLQYIRSFAFQEYPDPIEIACGTYDERLKESSQPILNMLETICKNDANALDEAISAVTLLMNAYSEVYAEIGIKVGARFIYQLLLTDD